MSDFDDLLKGIKNGLGELAEEAQKKYNDLTNYLDTHDANEIKRDLIDMADKTAADAKEHFEKAKDELKEVDLNEKLADVREDFQEGVSKAKETIGDGIEKVKEELQEMNVEEKIADVKEDIQEGMGKAKEVLGEGLDVVQKQFSELRKRFNL
ncbi:MAG: hypothetical protein IJK42_08980 [Prevotella sp.]|nr:hypothetical protein [Prevotella sp.]MBQ6209891.1 hypothetical protein [Prevotella sp.]